MISAPDRNTLCIRTALHRVVHAAIPESTVRPVDGELADVYLPWTYHNARTLANLGAPTASTIMRDYGYPELYGQYAPYEHQEQIAEFLTLHDRCFCFGGMGVGKTASAIWAAEYLISIGEAKKVLILCTKSTMNPAWGDTIFSLAPSRLYTVLSGPRAVRKRKACEKSTYHIINHDGVNVIFDELMENDYDTVIVDESTAYRNPTTRRWKQTNRITAKAKRVWALTGSPTPKSPEDAYGQVKLVVPEQVPKYARTWQMMTMRQVSMYKWEAKPDAVATVHTAMQPAIHVRKEDVLKNQPPTTIVHREVELTPEQTAMLKALRNKEVLRTKSGGTITQVHAAAALTKYMQIMLGSVYDDDGNVSDIDTGRIAEVIELIEAGRESGIGGWDAPLGKSIVAIPYRHVLELYAQQLEAAGYKIGVIHGDVSAKARDLIVKQFQTTQDIEVLLAIPNTIAHGLTLTAANTFIWCSPLVPPEIFQQANERMDRPGQTQHMTQARLYGSFIERQYYEVMEQRENWQHGLLNLYGRMIDSL